MGDTLEERLKSHARALEGLMSLIPAKDYYGKDESITSTQWQKRKKQTLQERQVAKRAKLDPASHKSAKDVMDESARKRMRVLQGEISGAEASNSDMEIMREKPYIDYKSKTKNQKLQAPDLSADEGDAGQRHATSRAQAKADARAEKKREKRKEKTAQKKQKQEARKVQHVQSNTNSSTVANSKDETEEDDAWEDDSAHSDDRMQDLDVHGLVEEAPVFSTPSTTSFSPSSDTEALETKVKSPFKLDAKSHENFRARLNARLDAMRAARKADGPDGRPARNRAELIEARRKKEAERRAAKKISRQEARDEEARRKAEEELARIRGGSGSPSTFPARSPDCERNLSFGKVAWDKQQLEGNLSGFLEARKRKGKSDAKTALEAAQKKQARVDSFDEDKRKDIQEKDAWLAAKKRAQGERVFNDLGLLKKTLKRQQKQKERSKQEWKERLMNVQQGKEAKQKKREENLKKRREEKGQRGKTKIKKAGKKVKRPGFEGTFKAR